MRAAFAIAALAGSAIAAPSYGAGYGNPKEEVHNVVVVETVVKTVYVTEGYEVPAPTSKVYEAPAAPTTTVYEKPAEPTYPAYEPPAPVYPTPEAPKPTVAPKPTAAPAPPSNSGYMGVVDEWRSKMGLKALAHDSKLESNALTALKKAPGRMEHFLGSGTFGQVLAMGDENKFTDVFVGGWLCERKNLPGLDGICDTLSAGWDYQGQTGHADILTSDQYSKIACAYNEGVWCCDLA
jgi:hypothetical protein